MSFSPPLKDIWESHFLTFIARKIKQPWKHFFLILGFSSSEPDHWNHDKPFLLEAIVKGLEEWKEKPPMCLKERNVTEIREWIINGLEIICQRTDLADEIRKSEKDLDGIIDMLSFELTEDRQLLFGALGIPIKEPTEYKLSLKESTKVILRDWLDRQIKKYWKYQELLQAFREHGQNSEADDIIKEYNLKENVLFTEQNTESKGKVQTNSDTPPAFCNDSSKSPRKVETSQYQSGKGHNNVETSTVQYNSDEGVKRAPSLSSSGLPIFLSTKEPDLEENAGRTNTTNTQAARTSDIEVLYQRKTEYMVSAVQQAQSPPEINPNFQRGLVANKVNIDNKTESELNTMENESLVTTGENTARICGKRTSCEAFGSDKQSQMKKIKLDVMQKCSGQENVSVGNIRRVVDSSVSNIKLRDYQQELAEVALQGINTIVCAGTNAGKTYVALYVIEQHLKNKPEGKVAFMTRTNVLLDQQFGTAINLLKTWSSKGKIRKWEAGQDVTSETFKNLLNRSSVMFMTPKSLCNYLEEQTDTSKVDINQFTLLVLDECHHTYGKSPFNEIMSHYRMKKYGEGTTSLPQILGLTASPGTNRAKTKFDAFDHLKRIMANLDVCKLSNVRNHLSSLMEYTSIPEKVIISSKKRTSDPVKTILTKAMDNVEDIFDCRQVNTYLRDPCNEAESIFTAFENPPRDRTTQKYILWLSETKKKIEELLKNESPILRLLHACLRHLEFYASVLEINSLLDISYVRTVLKDGIQQLKEESTKAIDKKEIEIVSQLDDVCAEIYGLGRRIEGNPDVENVIKALKEEYEKQGDESRSLIFVKTRTTAKALAEKLPEEFNSRHLTGSQVSKEEGGLSRDEQTDIVNRFREGKHLCLVATSVACEGLDIPQCTLMIRYRLKPNEISSLQMRGRIRQTGGKEYLVATQDEVEREEVNVERQYLMKLAIDDALKEDLTDKIRVAELNAYQMEEQEREKQRAHPNMQNKGKFYITCNRCGKYIVDGRCIRRIKQTHSIICDKEIFAKIERRKTKKMQVFDVIKKTDKVYGFECGHNWGSIMIYEECEFVSLSQDYIQIIAKETGEPLSSRKWSDIHLAFPLDDITEEEIIKYRQTPAPKVDLNAS